MPEIISTFFLAQSVWWISSILGLQEGLVVHVDNLRIQLEVYSESASIGVSIRQKIPEPLSQDSGHSSVHPSRVSRILNSDNDHSGTEGESDRSSETDIYNEIINNCEEFLEQSQRETEAVGWFKQPINRIMKW